MTINISQKLLPQFSESPVYPSPSLELRNLSELPYAQSSETPINSNVIAVQLLDPLIGNTVYEGSSTQEVTEQFIKILQSIKSEPYGHVLADILPLFDQCLEIDKEITNKISKTIARGDYYNNNLDLTHLKNFAKTLAEKIHQLKAGQRVLLPGGWVDAALKGHAVLYCIERTSETAFKFLIFNAGKGVQYHPGYVDKDSQSYYQGFVEIDEIPLERMSEKIFQGIIEALTLPKILYHSEPSEEIIYISIVSALGGKLIPPLDPVKYGSFYNKPQRSRICSFKSRLLTLKYLILQESLKHPEKQKDLLRAYKKIRFMHKKALLMQTGRNFFLETAAWNRETHKIISTGSRLLGRMSKKLVKQGILSEVELKQTLATLLDIRSSLKSKTQNYKKSLNSVTFKYTQELGSEGLPKIQYEFSGIDSLVPEEKKFSWQPKKTKRKNICLPQIPEQITPQNIGLYLQEWTKIPIDLIDSMPRISRSNAVVESLRALPIPKLNNSGEFWGQVPEKDIEGCLEGLFKLARLYNYEKDTDVSSPAGFIELNAALAMAEALARRKPEYKLRGYKLPYQQIFRFATNPSLILVNPVDHSRLEALLAYADSRVETHFPLTLQNDPTDFLFALHPESFTIDEKAVAQVQEWKYYTQFLFKSILLANP
jgi:hypothetical protein